MSPKKDISGMQNWQESYLAFEKIYIQLKGTDKIFTISSSLKKILKEKGSGIPFLF